MKSDIPRLMLAAPSSGSGKTTLTLSLLGSLVSRDMKPSAFKCGPDYIDLMFYRRMLGLPHQNSGQESSQQEAVAFLQQSSASFQESETPLHESVAPLHEPATPLQKLATPLHESKAPLQDPRATDIPGYNLDLFFSSPDVVRGLLATGAKASDIAVLEGVMGFYDGAGMTTTASSWHLADVTSTPVVLVVQPKGASLSVAALIQGFMHFKEQSGIKGVVLNMCSTSFGDKLASLIERECGIKVYGSMPRIAEAEIQSRHLGLVTPDDLEELQRKLRLLTAACTQNIDIDGLLELAHTAPAIEASLPHITPLEHASHTAPSEVPLSNTTSSEAALLHTAPREQTMHVAPPEASLSHIALPAASQPQSTPQKHTTRIAVAQDEAFCFYYRENLEMLEALGAELVPFSPLRDSELPHHISGLYLGGGYPELYAKTLSNNEAMLASLSTALQKGLPTLAECGGFLYLGKSLSDETGEAYPMVGALEGTASNSHKLGRFGYVTLTADEDTLICSKGETVKGHEFHYWESTDPGRSFTAQKPHSPQHWPCVHSSNSLYAGFPHLYFWSNPSCATRFVQAAAAYTETLDTSTTQKSCM